MPLITILAPGSRVRVPSMHIEGTVTRAVMSTGVNPLSYRVEWSEAGKLKSGEWFDSAVEEIDPPTSPVATQQSLPKTMAQIGQMIADSQKRNTK